MNPINLPDCDGRVGRIRQLFVEDVIFRVVVGAVDGEPVYVVVNVNGGVGKIVFDNV